MPSINDWAAKAARRILEEKFILAQSKEGKEARVAAIIATFAEPLMALVRESRREHGYLCVKCKMTLAYGGMPVPKEKIEEGTCTCGADEWNAKVEAALDGYSS